MSDDTMRQEFILYATPTGQLAEQCAGFWQAVNHLGPTTAQTYPPHISLTGFFHRLPAQASTGSQELPASQGVLAVPLGAVEVTELLVTDSWVGLAIESPWLKEVTAAIITADHLGPGDDEMRPKDWLHLSLAYGLDAVSLQPYVAVAKELVDPAAAAGWEVAVWERAVGAAPAWIRH